MFGCPCACTDWLCTRRTKSKYFSKSGSPNCGSHLMLLPLICPEDIHLCRFGAGTAANPPPQMVDGCGYFEFAEKEGDDKFTVKLATKPIKSKCMCIKAKSESSFLVCLLPCIRIVVFLQMLSFKSLENGFATLLRPR